MIPAHAIYAPPASGSPELADLAARIPRVEVTAELLAARATGPRVMARLGPYRLPAVEVVDMGKRKGLAVSLRVTSTYATLALVWVGGEDAPRWVDAERIGE